ncbi:MAG: ribosome silencing factor [Coxiella sp. RIFCSPHIGHO2_12_FULL_44_14]|nr:MAG: ribosome silencing factor [Coxiella sp. RIFCSPHIGHO2_12_FULL_44_14]
MTTEQLAQWVTALLDTHKALQITELDVTSLTDITDRMILGSATSKRHAATLAEKIIMESKAQGTPPLGVEGEANAEWILIDLQDVIVHIMLPEIRDFYSLEKLWSMTKTVRKNVSIDDQR